jgi:hypothetical protein
MVMIVMDFSLFTRVILNLQYCYVLRLGAYWFNSVEREGKKMVDDLNEYRRKNGAPTKPKFQQVSSNLILWSILPLCAFLSVHFRFLFCYWAG